MTVYHNPSDRQTRLAMKLRGYLRRRKLPFVIEQEGTAIILQLQGDSPLRACRP